MKCHQLPIAFAAIAFSTLSPARAVPIVSVNATLTPPAAPALPQVTNNDQPRSSLFTFENGALHQTQAEAVAQNNYQVSIAASVASAGSSIVAAKWQDTFTNSSGEALRYSFTYKINAGSIRSVSPVQGRFSDHSGRFDSILSVNNNIVNSIVREVELQRFAPPPLPATPPNPVDTLTSVGQALNGEVYKPVGFGGTQNDSVSLEWLDTYITVDLGTFLPGQAFTLNYVLGAIVTGTQVTGCPQLCNTQVFFSSLGNTFVNDDPRIGLSFRSLNTNVPEPMAAGLLFMGIASLGMARRRRR